jgi:hypothetical protein
MQSRTRIYLFWAEIMVSLLATGCVSHRRFMVSLNSHPTAPVMDLRSNYVEINHFSNTVGVVAHEFWSCREQGTEVVCQRQCGAKLEYACPGLSGDQVGE